MIEQKLSCAALIVVLIFTTGIREVCGQTLPKITPPSPNASTLGKYGDVPVNLYSGTASLSVPLYTISCGDISVPVSLSYHTGGIRLNEYAGWTGLGWALNAGGVISRTVYGSDDLMSPNTLSPELITKGQITDHYPPTNDNSMTMMSNMQPAYLYSTKGESFDFNNVMDLMGTSLDVEYDIFSYNFLDKSGRFIITRTGNIILEKADDIIISMENGLHVTDEKGFIYYFDETETAQREQPIQQYITSWYLTRIESPKGDRVDFTYKHSAVPVMGQLNQSKTFAGCFESNPPDTYLSTSFNYTSILDKITYNNGHVQFTTDNLRQDYPGDRITGVNVFSTFTTDTLKQYVFDYSYFNQDISTPGKNYKRLRLDKVTEKSGGTKLPPYAFTYKDPVIPNNSDIESFSKDHWGYYNARVNSQILPRFKGYVTEWSVGVQGNQVYYDLPGADREPNPEAMPAFSLSEMKYPTGGKTVLELEANTYEYSVTEAIQDNISNPPTVDSTKVMSFLGRGEFSGTLLFNHAFSSQVTVNVGFVGSNINDWQHYRNTYEKIWFEIGNQRVDIGGDLVTCGGPDCHFTFYIPTNTVLNWKAFIDPSVGTDFQRINVMMTWVDYAFQNQTNNDRFFYTGGLRVKRISDYDYNGQLVKSKRYEYHYDADKNGDQINERHSYGKRLGLPPTYGKYTVLVYEDGSCAGNNCVPSYCHNFTRASSTMIPLSATVGYDFVTEFSEDATGDLPGKTVFEFENEPDSIYHYVLPPDVLRRIPAGLSSLRPAGVPNLANKKNGTQKSRIDYQLAGSVYQPVKETRQEYNSVILNNYFSLKRDNLNVFGETLYLTYYYPSIREERVLLTKTTEKIYDLKDPSKFVMTEDTYSYNNNHEQVVQHKRKDSEGQYRIEQKIYPPDYGTLSSNISGIKNLKDKNILTPVEQYTIVQNRDAGMQYVTGGTLTTYKQNVPLPDQVNVLELSSPILLSSFNPSNKTSNTFTKDTRYQPRLFFQKYDQAGNLVSVSRSDDVVLSYCWGYNNSYPVAEVKNANDDKIFYTSFEEDVTNTSPVAKTGLKSYAAAYTVVLPTAGTYNLSYWKKTGAGNWQKIEDTVSSNTTIGGSGSLVDEVRLFPKDAQMTTYTYLPGIGVKSITDYNNISAYYEYDTFGRLQVIKDDKGNILKTYLYHYRQ